MNIATFANWGFLKYAINLYHQLKKFDMHKNLTIYTYGNGHIYTKVKDLGFECDVREFKTNFFNFDKFEHFQKQVNCGEDVSYGRYCAYKLETLYQNVKEKGFTLLIDSDTGIFENIQKQTEEEMGDKNIGIKLYLNHPYNTFPCYVQNKIVNGGFLAGKDHEHFYKFYEDVFKILDKEYETEFGNLDESVMACEINKYIENGKDYFAFFSDELNLLSDKENRYLPWDINPTEEDRKVKRFCKSYHCTFMPGNQKETFLERLGCWDFRSNIESWRKLNQSLWTDMPIPSIKKVNEMEPEIGLEPITA